jgi:hypothetical protein
MCLTVYFNGQFWVGVFEETSAGGLHACQHLFGAEPRDQEVLALVRSFRMDELLGAAMKAGDVHAPRLAANPKRLAREAAKSVHQRGAGTRSQEALKLAHEAAAEKRAVNARAIREEQKARRREIAREKALKRHKGR